jgi:transposase
MIAPSSVDASPVAERAPDTLATGTEVVMESCGTAPYWGRRAQARDAVVRLLPVQYVRPYVRRNKTDRTDAEALLEANRCGSIQPVPVKTVEQQARQTLHRVRTQGQAARTARINVMRGVLREPDLPIGVGARGALTRITAMLEDGDLAVPGRAAPPPSQRDSKVRRRESEVFTSHDSPPPIRGRGGA